MQQIYSALQTFLTLAISDLRSAPDPLEFSVSEENVGFKLLVKHGWKVSILFDIHAIIRRVYVECRKAAAWAKNVRVFCFL